MSQFDYTTLVSRTKQTVAFVDEITTELHRLLDGCRDGVVTAPERRAIAMLLTSLIVVNEALPSIEDVYHDDAEEPPDFSTVCPMWADTTVMH